MNLQTQDRQEPPEIGPPPMPEPLAPTQPATAFRPSPHDLQIGLASDAGCIRPRNEDASLAWQFLLAQEGQPPLPLGLFILADGMGGHAQGEQASALGVRMAAEYVIRHLCLPLVSEDWQDRERRPINEILESSMQVAHRALTRRFPDAGTTMTLALVLGNGVYLAHVGDSRAYLGQPGNLRPLTQDHSVAARLVEMGQASAQDAAAQRNVLYKALGKSERVEPDILYRDFEPGHYLLLCCDGLWGLVSDEEMAAIVENAPSPDVACQALVAQAKEEGGEDNISAILVARGWPLPGGPRPAPPG